MNKIVPGILTVMFTALVFLLLLWGIISVVREIV